MKKVYFFIIWITVLISLIGCTKKNNSKQNSGIIEENQNEENFIEIFGIVKTSIIKSINLTFDAQIDTIPVKEGQKVKKDDVLLTLSFVDFKIKIKQIEYELLNEQFELKKLSLENYGPNSLKYAIQKKKVDNLKFELNLLKNTLKKNNIINSQLCCTISNGVISEIKHNEGDFIEKGWTIMSIYDLDTINIIADIPEEFIKEIQVGDKVTIIPVADRSKNYNGRINRIYDVATQKGGETIILTEISIENKDDFLLPNYNVDVRIKNFKE